MLQTKPLSLRKKTINCERPEAEKLLKKLRSMEKPTSIPREKYGVLHSQMTNEGDENEDFTIEEDLPTR